jgi:hypothetical protein
MPEKKIDPNEALRAILARMLAGGANDQNYEKPLDAQAPEEAPAASAWSQAPQGWGAGPSPAPVDRFAGLKPQDPFAAQSDEEKRLTDPTDRGYQGAHWRWDGTRWNKPSKFAR